MEDSMVKKLEIEVDIGDDDFVLEYDVEYLYENNKNYRINHEENKRREGNGLKILTSPKKNSPTRG